MIVNVHGCAPSQLQRPMISRQLDSCQSQSHVPVLSGLNLLCCLVFYFSWARGSRSVRGSKLALQSYKAWKCQACGRGGNHPRQNQCRHCGAYSQPQQPKKKGSVRQHKRAAEQQQQQQQSRVSRKSRRRQKKHDQAKARETADQVGPFGYIGLKTAFETLAGRGVLPYLAQQPPNFYEEFKAQGEWPSSDPDAVDACHRLLQDFFLDNCTRLNGQAFKEGKENFGFQDWLKRFGNPVRMDVGLVRLREFNFTPGDVIEESVNTDDMGTEEGQYHFTNHSHKVTMFNGTTHVAIGFNDLSVLLNCELEGENNHGQLRFFGVDQSSYSVAKSLVLVQMLRQDTPIENCLQVFLSSTWSCEALEAFRRCAQQSAAECDDDESVHSLLLHWSTATPLSVEEAQACWRRTRISGQGRDIACLRNVADRLAMCRYVLTGSLPTSTATKQEVGSLTMWCDKTRMAHYGSAYHILNMNDLANAPSELDIIGKLCEICGQRLLRLRKWLIEGKLCVELWHRRVSVTERSTLAWIAECQPVTVSWSNVLDYTGSVDEFHFLAQVCGKRATHFGYSMNWNARVLGTNAVDYPAGSSARAKAVDASYEWVKSRDSSPLVALLPYDNAVNYTCVYLANQFYRHWVDWFFKAAPTENLQASVAPYCPWSCNPHVVEISWKYN